MRKRIYSFYFCKRFTATFYRKEKSNKDYANLVYSKAELMKYAAALDVDIDKDEFAKLGIDIEKFKNDLSVDKLRLENPFGESEYTGDISINISDEAKTKLAEQKEKQYSASQLEEYAKCPFQYFLKRILQLETIEEPNEELESFELGSIIHSILYEFYKTL